MIIVSPSTVLPWELAKVSGIALACVLEAFCCPAFEIVLILLPKVVTTPGIFIIFLEHLLNKGVAFVLIGG